MPKIRHSKQFEFCIFTNLAILVKLMILVNLVNLVNLVKLELESSGIARKREGGILFMASLTLYDGSVSGP